MLVLLERDGMVVTTRVPEGAFDVAVEAPDDIVLGDHYINGEWVRDGERLPEPEPQFTEYDQMRADLDFLLMMNNFDVRGGADE